MRPAAMAAMKRERGMAAAMMQARTRAICAQPFSVMVSQAFWAQQRPQEVGQQRGSHRAAEDQLGHHTRSQPMA